MAYEFKQRSPESQKVLDTITLLREHATKKQQDLIREVREEESAKVAQGAHKDREPQGRELGAKIELAAVQRGMRLLQRAEAGVTETGSLANPVAFKDTMLDIPPSIYDARQPLGKTGEEKIYGLHEYLARKNQLTPHQLQYPNNPAIAFRAIEELYRPESRARVRDFEVMAEDMFKKVKGTGEPEIVGTDVENVSIEFARAPVKREHSEEIEQNLRMSVIVDYLKESGQRK